MYFTRKKIIIFLIICLIFVLIKMYYNNNYNIKNQKSIETNGNPVSSHIVILDAGHGEPDRRCNI